MGKVTQLSPTHPVSSDNSVILTVNLSLDCPKFLIGEYNLPMPAISKTSQSLY